MSGAICKACNGTGYKDEPDGSKYSLCLHCLGAGLEPRGPDGVLRHHVTGAIERGEAVPIVEVRPTVGQPVFNDPPRVASLMDSILDISKDHEADCQCPWDRAFDALAELPRS